MTCCEAALIKSYHALKRAHRKLIDVYDMADAAGFEDISRYPLYFIAAGVEHVERLHGCRAPFRQQLAAVSRLENAIDVATNECAADINL
ncbi:hypothetical protein [Methylobacterium gregans]